ncbi:protein kinase domain-containing protein, partial [Actinoplanes rectilineatus]
IHRDLKPGNVLMARGGIKVIDFGIARAFEATSHHTRTDQMVGTISYMAPERFDPVDGRPVTAAADIFAWGAVVTFAATGRTPFQAESPPATAMRILTQEPDLRGIPDPLRGVVESALAKEPRDRPTARELLDMLLTGGSLTTRVTTPPIPVPLPVSDDTPPPMPASAPVPAPVSASPAVPVAPVPPVPKKRRGRKVMIAVAGAVTLFCAAPLGLLVLHDSAPSASDSFDAEITQTPEPQTPEEIQAAILRGERKILIRLGSGPGSVMRVDLDETDLDLGQDNGDESLFVLEPQVLGYMIRAWTDPVQDTCVSVGDDGDPLEVSDCIAEPENVFLVTPTGSADAGEHPLYQIVHQTLGPIRWDREEDVLTASREGGGIDEFVFVDQGPADS